MGKIISNDELKEHSVKKFEFVSLNIQEEKSHFDATLFDAAQETNEVEATQESAQEENIDAPTPSQEATELLAKIETLTNENISLDMQLQTLQTEFDSKLQEATDQAYKKGQEEGIQESQNTLQEQSEALQTQLLKSISTLDEQTQRLNDFLIKIEDELIDASMIIAKKVIKKEIEEHSQEVALTLAKDFLQDLKDATTITLKINPQDATALTEHFAQSKNITISPDDAINKGGIIILSDAGNIDGNIDIRLEKALALIEREG